MNTAAEPRTRSTFVTGESHKLVNHKNKCRPLAGDVIVNAASDTILPLYGRCMCVCVYAICGCVRACRCYDPIRLPADLRRGCGRLSWRYERTSIRPSIHPSQCHRQLRCSKLDLPDLTHPSQSIVSQRTSHPIPSHPIKMYR